MPSHARLARSFQAGPRQLSLLSRNELAAVVGSATCAGLLGQTRTLTISRTPKGHPQNLPVSPYRTTLIGNYGREILVSHSFTGSEWNQIRQTRPFAATLPRKDKGKPVEAANPLPIPTSPQPAPDIPSVENPPSEKPAAVVQSGVDPDQIDKRVWPITASSLLMGIAVGVVIPLLPLLSKEMGLSTSEFGFLISSMGLARLILNVPAATLVDRIGRKPLLVGGPIMTSISMIGTGLASSLSELVTWRLMTGAGGSLQMSGAQSYLSDISTTRNRARTIAPTSIAFQVGFSIGPSISGLLAESYGFRPPFFFVGAAIGLVALNNYLSLPETLVKKPVGSAGTIQAAKPAPASVAQIVHTDGRISPPPVHAEPAKQSVFEIWRNLLRDPDVRRISMLHCMFWICQSGAIITLFPLYASAKFGLGVSTIGTIFTVNAIVGAFGAQPSAWFSDKYGRKAALVPAMTMISTGILLLPLASNTLQLYACTGLWAVGSALVGSSTTAYMADLTRGSVRGQALGLLRSSGDLGLMLGAATLGSIAQQWGLGTAFVVNGIAYLLVVARFAWASKETAGKWAKK